MENVTRWINNFFIVTAILTAPITFALLGFTIGIIVVVGAGVIFVWTRSE